MSEPAKSSEPKSAWQGWLAALVIGAVGWWLACQLSGKKEAWDSAYYGRVSYPLFVLGAAVLGFIYRTRPWRWPLAIALGQAIVLFTRGPVGNLAPLGLVAFLVLSAPLLVPALLGARLRHWRDPSE
ncbi:MAG TPA: hypothetical protein VG734_06320 [Lacunisphaera sp.]|nr:hypothetical protein [Lacunisphaera sp.]